MSASRDVRFMAWASALSFRLENVMALRMGGCVTLSEWIGRVQKTEQSAL